MPEKKWPQTDSEGSPLAAAPVAMEERGLGMLGEGDFEIGFPGPVRDHLRANYPGGVAQARRDIGRWFGAWLED